jgi:hypothetical protein
MSDRIPVELTSLEIVMLAEAMTEKAQESRDAMKWQDSIENIWTSRVLKEQEAIVQRLYSAKFEAE